MGLKSNKLDVACYKLDVTSLLQARCSNKLDVIIQTFTIMLR